MYYIYQLRLANSTTPFYIGKGTGYRSTYHLTPSSRKAKTHKNHVINKAIRDGVDVLVEILHEGLSESEAHAKEVELIAFYGRHNFGGCLTNATDGGEGSSGYVATPETRRKLSAVNIGKRHSEQTKAKISAGNRGRKRTDEQRARMSSVKSKMSAETKAKMSASHTGVKRNADHADAIRFSKWDLNPAYKHADKIYTEWLNAGKPGRVGTEKIFPGAGGLSRKFYNGWNPGEDSKWQSYMAL
jgi:hypothetical protein